MRAINNKKHFYNTAKFFENCFILSKRLTLFLCIIFNYVTNPQIKNLCYSKLQTNKCETRLALNGALHLLTHILLSRMSVCGDLE